VKRIIVIIALAFIVLWAISCKNDRGTVLNLPFGFGNNGAKDITSFIINGVLGTINGSNITLTLPFGTNLTNLVANFTINGDIEKTNVEVNGVKQSSGDTQNDFTNPVTYKVTAADNTTKDYTVTVTVAINSAKDITQFTILGINGTIGSKTIALTVPNGTDRSSLTPTITHTGASISPLSGVPANFMDTVNYTVTAADSSTKVYTVTVTVAASYAKDITQFTILGIDGTIGANTIALTVPYGTDVTSLTPTIIHTGASVSPLSGVPNNFTNTVNYSVTAADSSTKVYAVTVTAAANPAKDITQFTILGINGTIGANTIALTMPYGTDVTSLTPTIIHEGASVSPLSGVAENFTNPVNYTVTAADASTKVYTVTVSVAPSPAKNITKFTILGIDGTIVEGGGAGTITLTVPYGTDVTSLTPTIIHEGASVSPLSGVPNNFTNTVNYTVTAADSSTKVYAVTVTAAANPAKDITQFTILGIDGTIVEGIDAGTIAVTVPFETDVTSLTPTIIHEGASVSPDSGETVSFTTPVDYTVTAADGTTKVYSVTVTPSLAP